MAGVFGQVSGSFGVSREFGNARNSSNPFAINTTGTTNFPSLSTQGSGFGGSTTNVFGATSSSFGNASNSSNPFAINTTGTTNFPSLSTQGSGFGGSTTNVFGAMSSSFGNASNSSNPFAINATGTTNFPSLSTQGSGFGGSTTNVFGATSSSFGNASNSSNPFAINTTGNTNFPSLSTQGSGFGGITTNVFGATSSSYGNVSNSSNLFAPNTTGTTNFPSLSNQGSRGSTTSIFGATSSLFGNSSNSSNSFTPNTKGATNFPSLSTQGSGFGGSTTNVFGATFGNASNLSNSFAPNTTGTTNFPNLSTQGSGFGSSTTNIFGATSSSSGNASNSSNPFPLTNQGSVFGSSATNVFGAPSSSSVASSSNFLFGQASCSTNSNHNAFALNTFGTASNSSPNPFAPSTFRTTTSPSFTSQGSFFGGTSTAFGKPTSIFGSSTVGTTTSASHGPFGSTTGGTFGGPSPSLFGQGSGSSASLSIFGNKTIFGHISLASNTVASTTISSSPTQRSPFGGTSAGLFGASSSSFLSSPATFSFLQPFCGQNTGCRNKPYEHTIIKDDLMKSYKLRSVSAMPFYESKSHEELRWEDYELKSGGQRSSVGNQTPEVNKQQFSFPLPSVTSSVGILGPSCSVPASSTNISTPTFSIPDSSPNLSAFRGCHQVTASVINNQPLQNPQIPTQDVGVWPNHLLGSALTTPSPYNENSVIHTIQAPSPWTAAPVSAGNNGGASLDVRLPHIGLPEQLPVPGKVMESIIAMKDPFGPEPARSRPLFGHSACSFVQHGISSMPVSNKPAQTRVPSYFTSRHHSLKPLSVNVRKYHPSRDGPKVPFFDRAEDIQNIRKTYSYIVPRENPRSVIAASTKPTQVNASEKEASPLNHASAVDYEDCRDNAKKAQISRKDHFAEASDNAKEINELLIPKLQRSDYYTEPKIEKLVSIESSNPGFCCHVKDFVVGRDGYGCVKFHGETNVRGLNLDSLVHFNYREVIVYADENEKPPVGQGLNKAAEVTLLNVKCINKTGKQYTSGKMVDKYIEKLKQVAEKQGVEFVSYDPVIGEWKFSVQHF